MPDDERLFRVRPKRRGFGLPAPAGFAGYGWAYRRAADYLVGVLQESGASNQLLNLPVVFLYRHAIEVTVKGILVEYGPGVGVEKTKVIDRKHDLVAQLDDLKRVAESVDVGISPALGSRVQELQHYDPGSFDSRYPEDISGKKDLEARWPHFDLESFARGAELVLDELFDLMNELEADFMRSILSEEGILD